MNVCKNLSYQNINKFVEVIVIFIILHIQHFKTCTYEQNFELVLYTVIRQVYQEIRNNTLPEPPGTRCRTLTTALTKTWASRANAYSEYPKRP